MLADRLFIGIFPAGISYADKEREEHGEWLRLAFFDFATLQLQVGSKCSEEFEKIIRRDAAQIMRKAGEQYETSGCGQTVTLGHALPPEVIELRKREAEEWLRHNPKPREYRGCVIWPKNVYGMYSANTGQGQVSADTLRGIKQAIREALNR